jgi:hypothetical protein
MSSVTAPTRRVGEVTFSTPIQNGFFGHYVQTQDGSYTEIYLGGHPRNGGERIGYIEKVMAYSWTGFVSAYIVWGLEPGHKAMGHRPGHVQKPWGNTTSERWFNTHGYSGDVYPGARPALAAAKRYARETLIDINREAP